MRIARQDNATDRRSSVGLGTGAHFSKPFAMRCSTLLSTLVATLAAALLAACGGGGGGGSNDAPPASTAPPVLANAMTVTIDAGPAALTNINELAVNVLYATVTVCNPGTSVCKSIDHVQVDTGSVGLRLLASALTGITPAAANDPSTGRPLLECVQFADGYSWGTVGTADVTLGPRTLSGLAVHVIGDPAAGAAPSSCVSGPSENTVFDFGANGVLGVGNFLQDCGPACAQQAIAATYYVCPTSAGGNACTPVSVALTRQVLNPVSRLSADNNGVQIRLPAVASPGVPTLTGTMLFGVGTQGDNGTRRGDGLQADVGRHVHGDLRGRVGAGQLHRLGLERVLLHDRERRDVRRRELLLLPRHVVGDPDVAAGQRDDQRHERRQLDGVVLDRQRRPAVRDERHGAAGARRTERLARQRQRERLRLRPAVLLRPQRVGPDRGRRRQRRHRAGRRVLNAARAGRSIVDPAGRRDDAVLAVVARDRDPSGRSVFPEPEMTTPRIQATLRAASLIATALFCTAAAAQIVAPAPAPNGRNPAVAPSPSATAVSPGAASAPTAVAPSGPTPEARSTSPGAPAAPPSLPTPSAGVPPRIVPPDAPATLPDPVEPTTPIAPTDPVRRVRPVPGAPGTLAVPTPSVPAPVAVPPSSVAPSAPRVPGTPPAPPAQVAPTAPGATPAVR